MMGWIAVAIGGAAGACLRHGVGLAVTSMGSASWRATAVVNVVGCLLLGLLLGRSQSTGLDPNLKLLVATGFCGALTTFSTFSTDVVALLEERQFALALAVGFGQATLGLVCAALGLWIGRAT